MGSIKNIILCSVFSILSVMNFCAQTQVRNQAVTQEFKSFRSYVTDYIFFKMRDFGFKIFYNYLDSVLIDYKNKNIVNYKVGMRYISGRYIFQDINQLYDGQTLLHQALALRNGQAMQILLFLGADSDVKNNQSFTPYDIAGHYKEPCFLQLLDVYKKLNKARADLQAQTMCQKYYVSMMQNLIAFQSMDKKALTFIVNSLDDYKNRHPFMTRLFLYMIDGKYIDDFINIADVDLTMLQHCINDNNIDLAQILLYFGADPMMQNCWGLSAFELCLKNKNIQFLKLFWPYISLDVLRSEMYPLLLVYKDELLECVRKQGSISFMNAVYHYFGMQIQDEQDHEPGMIVDFWN